MHELCGSWWLNRHLLLASCYVQDLDDEAGSPFGAVSKFFWDDGKDEIIVVIAQTGTCFRVRYHVACVLFHNLPSRYRFVCNTFDRSLLLLGLIKQHISACIKTLDHAVIL
jgi:hypothetical protein